MEHKTIMHLAIGFLLFPLVALLVIGGGANLAKVHAKENQLDQKQMAQMMQAHHGPDWKAECQDTMQDNG